MTQDYQTREAGAGMGAPHPAAAFDRESALSRLGGDLELLEEIAQLFLDDAPRMLGDIAAAVQRRDANGIGRSAHALKGCVLNFGAERLFEASLKLEQMGRTSDLGNVDAAYRALETELRRLEADLRSLLAHA